MSRVELFVNPPETSLLSGDVIVVLFLEEGAVRRIVDNKPKVFYNPKKGVFFQGEKEGVEVPIPQPNEFPEIVEHVLIQDARDCGAETVSDGWVCLEGRGFVSDRTRAQWTMSSAPALEE